MITPNNPWIIPSFNESFSDYARSCKQLVTSRRTDLTSLHKNTIITANIPYELQPQGEVEAGVLLIHGLLDCPFSVRDLGLALQKEGYWCSSVLLPGHGTTPADLLTVHFEDWLQVTRYGIENLSKKVKKLYILGFSTGAALGIYQALMDQRVQGLVLLAPAIQIKAPVDALFTLQNFLKRFNRKLDWVQQRPETDYTKYRSLTYNAVSQVAQLTQLIKDALPHYPLNCPMCMIVSDADETISSKMAMQFFEQYEKPQSRLLIYTAKDLRFDDKRILTRQSAYPELNITNFSHVALPYSPENPHYGPNGDYPPAKKGVNGAYDPITLQFFKTLYEFNLLDTPRGVLTYNPDFEFMSQRVIQFLKSL